MAGSILVRAAIAAACLGTVLTGCGGSSSAPGEVAAAGSTAASAAADPATSKAAFTDAEACAWLKENLPTYTTSRPRSG